MELKHHWQLRDDLHFLNHGSFGATPRVVLEKQSAYRDALERDPIEFLAPERSLLGRLDHVRCHLGKLLTAPTSDLVFVRNATDGVNAVVRSLPLEPGDEVIVTSHGYNACNNAAKVVATAAQADVVVAAVPFPISSPDQVIEAVDRVRSARTRLLLIDHVTSPTGLVFPVRQLIEHAHRFGIPVLVDGAHAPGMLPVNLTQLGADFYTGNHHKWLCAPKASGFLYVDPKWQSIMRPTVISHGENKCFPGRSAFQSRFDWVGTYDPTPILCVSDAIEFLENVVLGGLPEIMRRNRSLAIESQRELSETLGISVPAPESMIGSLVTVPIRPCHSDAEDTQWGEKMQLELYRDHSIELPIFSGSQSGHWHMRVSIQVYNDPDSIHRLSEVLRHWRNAGRIAVAAV